MNRFCQSLLFLACLLLPCLASAQVRFDGNFEGSAFGSAELLDSARLVVAPGDTVFSSGFSTIYPPDIPLGAVLNSEISKGSSQEITVRLFEDFRTLHNVYIVKDNRRKELDELYEQAR